MQLDTFLCHHYIYAFHYQFTKNLISKICISKNSSFVWVNSCVNESQWSHCWAHDETSWFKVEIICTWSRPRQMVSVGYCSLAIIQIIKSIFVMLMIKVGVKPSSDLLLIQWVHACTHLHSHNKTMQVVKWPVNKVTQCGKAFIKKFLSQLIACRSNQNACRGVFWL